MKKYWAFIFQIIAICFIAAYARAFDDKITHPAITEVAVEQSVLKTTDYLKNNLGFEKGRNEEIAPNPENTNKQISIEQVITNGAHTEDSGTLPSTYLCARGTNHFYDPVNKKGLDEWVGWAKRSVPNTLEPLTSRMGMRTELVRTQWIYYRLY